MKQTIRTCLFPAAGYGTRFLPATKAMPKEMLPILNKPLIQYSVEEAVEAGMDNIVFVTGRGKRALEDHFDVSYELEHQIQGTEVEKKLKKLRSIIANCSISYTRQNRMQGLGHAVLCGSHLIPEGPFAVVLADDLCHNQGEGILSQMTRLYEKHQCSIVAIMEVPGEEVGKYGIIQGEEVEPGLYEIEKMVEKPEPAEAPSNLAVIGRYIFTTEIFEHLKSTPPGKNGEIQLTDAISTLARKSKVLAYRFSGKRYDCGNVEGYVEATGDFYRLMQAGEI